MAGRERRDRRHADGARRRLAAARQGLPGRAVRGVVPLQRRVHRRRHGAVREGGRRDERRLHPDLGRRAIDRCGHRRCAGEDYQPRGAGAQRRKHGALCTAASSAERGGSGRWWRWWWSRRSGRARGPRGRRSVRVRVDVRGAAGCVLQGHRLEPRRSARRRRRLPLERQRPRQWGRHRRRHRQLWADRALCRRHRRGAVQGPRDQGPRAPDHTGRADLSTLPCAAVRGLLPRLVRRRRGFQSRRRARRDDWQPLLPRAVLHGIPRGLRGTGLQPGQGILAGDGQLRVRLHR